MMVAALAATMCVGFTSCDDKKGGNDDGLLFDSSFFMSKWVNYLAHCNIEFKENGAFSLNTPSIQTEGRYSIVSNLNTKLSYPKYVVQDDGTGMYQEVETDATLFIMEVTQCDYFDQMRVYCFIDMVKHEYVQPIRLIRVSLFSNNELVEESRDYAPPLF